MLADAAPRWPPTHFVAISNARLPKQPCEFTKELIDLLRQEPNGMTSYFMWLAEHHPAIFASLLGRAMPQIMQQEPGGDVFEAMSRRGH